MTKAVLEWATAPEITREAPTADFGHSSFPWCLVTPLSRAPGWTEVIPQQVKRRGQAGTAHPVQLEMLRAHRGQSGCRALCTVCQSARWEGRGTWGPKPPPFQTLQTEQGKKEKTPPRKRGVKALLCIHTCWKWEKGSPCPHCVVKTSLENTAV